MSILLLERFRRYRKTHGLWKSLQVIFARGLGYFVMFRRFYVLYRSIPTPPLEDPSLELREVIEADVDWYCANSLWQRTVVDMWRNQGKRCFSAWAEGEFVGYIWTSNTGTHLVEGMRLEYASGVFYHGPEFVFAQYRGRRIHERMVSQVADNLRAVGCSGAVCTVLHSNKPSLRGLRRAGYEPVQELWGVRLFKGVCLFIVHDLKQNTLLHWRGRAATGNTWGIIGSLFQ